MFIFYSCLRLSRKKASLLKLGQNNNILSVLSERHIIGPVMYQVYKSSGEFWVQSGCRNKKKKQQLQIRNTGETKPLEQFQLVSV
jgi:hypothetical protein